MVRPDHWPSIRLADAADIVVGQSPPGATYNVVGDGVPFFQGAGEFGSLHPTVSKWTTHDAPKMARKGAVLLSVRAPVGPTNLAQEDCAIGRGLVAVHARESFEQSFLLWALRHLASELARAGSGSTFSSVRSGQVRDLRIPAPSLEEQRAIIDTIERMLSQLDDGLNGVRTARRRLELLRSAVNNHAAYGQLHKVRGDRVDALEAVSMARGDRDDADILPVPVPDDITVPETWAWSSIDELADVQAGAAKSRKLEGADGCVERPYLSVANVQRGWLDLETVGTMWVRNSKVDDLTLQPGDVLFNEGGDKDKLGRGWVWEGQIEGCVHQNHVFRARLRTGDVDPRWLSHWGNVFGRWWFHARGSQTTGIASINKTVLRSLPVPVPPAIEQKAILDELERRRSQIDQAHKIVEAAEQRAGALRRSVLKAAFEGRLTCGAPEASLPDGLLEDTA